MSAEYQFPETIVEHYRGAGYSFGFSESDHRAMLAELLGEDRNERFWNVAKRRKTGETSLEDLFQFLETPKEAAAFVSADSEVTVGIGGWIIDRLIERRDYVTSIIEMGCGLGCLGDLISKILPNVTVVGVDRNERFLRFAEEVSAGIEILRCDYEVAVPQLERVSHIIACNPLNFTSGSDVRVDEIEHRLPSCFSNWRESIRDKGELFLALRLRELDEFVATVRAGERAGWEFGRADFSFLSLAQGVFPCMSFTSGGRVICEDDELAEVWAITKPLDSYKLRFN